MPQDLSRPPKQQATDPGRDPGAQPESAADKRIDPRREMAAQAFVSIPSLTSRAYEIREISRSGMFLAFKEIQSARLEFEQNGIEPGTHAEIAFAFSLNETRYRFSLSTEITRITRQGIGVQFTTHNPPQLAALREFFWQTDRTGDAEASPRHAARQDHGRQPRAGSASPPEGPDWELLD